MDPMTSLLEPGMIVTHPDEPEWGPGQVQSNIGGTVTIMFRHAGKVVIDARRIALIPLFQS